MNNMTRWSMVLGLSLILFSTLIFSGCTEGPDTSPATGYFDTNPYQSLQEEVVMATFYAMADPTSLSDNGDIATLTVVGGTPPYSWSVYTNAFGTIVATYGDTAIYRRIAGGNNLVAVADATGNETYVTIDQPGGVTGVSLTLFLSSSTLTANGQTCTISVLGTGGTPPYYFSVASLALGTLSSYASSNNVVTYTRVAAGTNEVGMVDSAGYTVSSRTILQP